MTRTSVLHQQFDHPIFAQISPSKARGKYVIVDPMDPDGLLYLNNREYILFNVNATANQEPLDVLLRPGDSLTRPSDDKGEGPEVPRSSRSRRSSSSILSSDRGSMDPDSDGGSGSHSYHSSTRRNPRSSSLNFNSVLYPSDFNTVRTASAQGLTGSSLRSLIESWGEILSIRLGYTLMDPTTRQNLTKVGQYFEKVFSNHGVRIAVLRMKVSVHCVNSYLAGSPLRCTRHLGEPVKLTAGLPSFLPLSVRSQIRVLDVRSIRLWVSVLSLYKGVSGFHGEPDLSTIMAQPQPGMSFDTRFDRFNSSFWSWINPTGSRPTWVSPKGDRMQVLRTAGPNNPISALGAPFDAYAWSCLTMNHLVNFLEATGQTSILTMYQASLARFSSETGRRCRNILVASKVSRLVKACSATPILGRLSLKYEPAGKIRVFAIVDGFTQSALKPLHDWMFSLIRELSVDATFDQEGRVRKFAIDHRKEDIFSYDLSSATDLIPFALTVEIMSSPLGTLADLWAKLMVDRDFETPVRGVPKVRYTRGQPIGALSSWSSLAVTHHWLVQLAADRVGKFPYSDYLVLGDDISISGRLVAESYLEVCKEFGVPINNKGINSPKSEGDSLVNFANQIVKGETNLSPIQVREEMSVTNVSARSEYLSRLVRRGVLNTTDPDFLYRAFRLCSSSVTQVRNGMRMFTRGVLPVGIADLMTAFLLPKQDVSVEGNSLTYVYVRLLAGIDILGGWSYYNSVPDLLNASIVLRRSMDDVFVELLLEIRSTMTYLLSNYMQFRRCPDDDARRDPRRLCPGRPFSLNYGVPVGNVNRLLDRYTEEVDKIKIVDTDQVTAARYLIAQDILSLFFIEEARYSQEIINAPSGLGNILNLFASLHISIMGGPERSKSICLGEVLSNLWKFLSALDDYHSFPVVNRGTVRAITNARGADPVSVFPHTEEFRMHVLYGPDFHVQPADVVRFPESPDFYGLTDDQLVFELESTERMNIRPFEELVKEKRVLWRAPRSLRFLTQFVRNPCVSHFITKGRGSLGPTEP